MAVKRWSGTAWEVYAGADVVPVKVTDGRPGKTTFIGATNPTGQVDGDIWIDQDTTTNAVVPTALTTKGDIFAATGNAAYTRFAAGNNGESLYADSTTSTGLRWQGDFNTGKNKILNGDFAINQRNFTSTGSANVYFADRWATSLWSGTVTFTSPTISYGSFIGQTSDKVLRATSGSSSNDLGLYTRIENVATFAGQTITISFWIRSSANTYNVDLVEALQAFGSGGSAATYTYADISNKTFSNNWTRLSFQIAVPSIAGKTVGPGSFLNLRIDPLTTLPNGEWVEITHIQAELGSIATPFTTNTANPQAELAACQRYYYRVSNTSSNYPFFGNYIAQSTTLAIGQVMIPVQMRLGSTSLSVALQSAGGYRLTNNANYTLSSIAYDTTYIYAAQNSVPIAAGTSGLTAGAMYFLVGNFNSNAEIEISAEL